MSLLNKMQLEECRKRGLKLTDEENESFNTQTDLAPFKSIGVFNWTDEQFEDYLKTRVGWDESTKDTHRKMFKGKIVIEESAIWYPH